MVEVVLLFVHLHFSPLVVKSEGFFYICSKSECSMKEEYRKLSNSELSNLISKKTRELIELRNELNKRAGESLPRVNYDFTKRITD